MTLGANYLIHTLIMRPASSLYVSSPLLGSLGSHRSVLGGERAKCMEMERIGVSSKFQDDMRFLAASLARGRHRRPGLRKVVAYCASGV